MIIAAPIMFGGYVLATPLILALYGEEFLPAAPSLQLLFLSLMFLFLNYPLSSLLGAINKQKVNMYFMGVAAFISILANILLIPTYGGVGSAFALFISLALLFMAYITYLHYAIRIPLRKYLYALVKIILLALLMALTVRYIANIFEWWGGLILGAILYPVLLFGTKSITKDEFKNLISGMKGTG